MPIIALFDGLSHVLRPWIFVFSMDFHRAYFFCLVRQSYVECIVLILLNKQCNFYGVIVGVGENEFVGPGI